jgi:hypothetical protein
MKHDKFSQDQNKKQASASRPAAAADSSQSAIDFAPSADEVARRAYFAFENEGSQPGRDVQHWLAAEAELIAERNLTRVHGFHNQT